MIGFAKLVGDLIDGLMQVALYFGLAALIAAVIIAFLVEMAGGKDGRPYSWLGAIAGVAYLAALAFLRWRS